MANAAYLQRYAPAVARGPAGISRESCAPSQSLGGIGAKRRRAAVANGAALIVLDDDGDAKRRHEAKDLLDFDEDVPHFVARELDADSDEDIHMLRAARATAAADARIRLPAESKMSNIIAAAPAAAAADPSPPRRRPRHDSEEAPVAVAADPSPPRRRPRHDSDDERERKDASPPRRAATNTGMHFPSHGGGLDAHGEDASSPPRRRPRHDSDDEAAGPLAAAATSHRAGADGLAVAAAPAVDFSGAAAGTVYRNRDGRRVDMRGEMQRQLAARADAAAAAVAMRYDVGTGAVQKLQRAEAAAELAAAAAAPFTRRAGDADVEAHLRARVLDGDPMAKFLTAKSSSAAGPPAAAASASLPFAPAAAVAAKPRYRGPAAPPNRFGILPGYRWDGVVRGSGWEQRVVQSASRRSARADNEYQWRVADM